MLPFGLRRLFRRKQLIILIATIGFVFMMYQFLSLRQLGQEIQTKRRVRFQRNFRGYEKADGAFDLKFFRDDDKIKDTGLVLVKRDDQDNPELNEVRQPDEPSQNKDKLPVMEEPQIQDMKVKPVPSFRPVWGVLFENQHFYAPASNGIFRCISNGFEIPFVQVNDDYCDCDDGSDEPSTSACPNTRFYCSFQPRDKEEPLYIQSSKVNDGICDCCDGSDEWLSLLPPPHAQLSEVIQAKIGIDQVPCQTHC